MNMDVVRRIHALLTPAEHRRAVLLLALMVGHARFSSARLPGKVLRPMRGPAIIGYLFEALAHCRTVDRVVLATSDDPSDVLIPRAPSSCSEACPPGSCRRFGPRRRRALRRHRERRRPSRSPAHVNMDVSCALWY